MPSFFRTDHDVRLLFGPDAPSTPEDRRQRDRLLTIFRQTLRRRGARGSFFYHRRSSSLGGRPILILEPQGPVDGGIFQGGLSRFGETLSGTFHTPESGHLVLETHENVSDASALKYSRDVRALIADIAGMMASGGDDRVQVVTPRQKAEAARRTAQQRRDEATARREQRREDAAREEEAADAVPIDAASIAHVLAQAPGVAAPSAGAQAQAAQQVLAVLADAEPDWLEAEGGLHDLDASLAEACVDIDALEASEARMQALVQRLGPVRDDAARREIQAALEGDPWLGTLAQPPDMDSLWEAVRTLQRRLREQREALKPQLEVVRSLRQQRRRGQERLEQGRRAALRALAEAGREQIRLHGGVHEAGRALVNVATRLERAEEALHWIAAAAGRVGTGGEDGEGDAGDPLSAVAQQDAMARQAVAQLQQEAAVLRGLGASALLRRLWAQRADLAAVRPSLEALAAGP